MPAIFCGFSPFLSSEELKRQKAARDKEVRTAARQFKKWQQEEPFRKLRFPQDDDFNCVGAAYADALSRCRRLERRLNRKLKVLTK